MFSKQNYICIEDRALLKLTSFVKRTSYSPVIDKKKMQSGYSNDTFVLCVEENRTTTSEVINAEVRTQHKTILDTNTLYSKNRDAKNVDKQ